MPFVKLDYVKKLMEEKNLPYFKITDGRTLIGKNNDESSPSKAIDSLDEILEMIEDSVVTISLSERPDKDKRAGGNNMNDYVFKVRLQGEGTNGIGSAGINGTVLSLMKENSDLLRKLEMQNRDQVIEGLKKEMQELKEKKNKPDVLDQYLPLLVQSLTGKPFNQPVAVAGHNDGPVNPDVMERLKKIKLQLMRLEKIDSDLVETLTMLADFAEQNPEKYRAFIPMLKAQL